MPITLRPVTNRQEAANAVSSTELGYKLNPGVEAKDLCYHWGDVHWFAIMLEEQILGYTYYNKITNILAELHGFAQTKIATQYSVEAMSVILKHLNKEGIRKVFVTMPANAVHVAKYLNKCGFKPCAKIQNSICHDYQLTDLFYLAKDI